MVRLKHRYLLVNILYPPTASNTLPVAKPLVQGKDTTEFAETEFHLQVCRPTPDYFKAQLLARMIRDTVSDTFGDWGMGKLGGAGAGRVSGESEAPDISRRGGL